MIGTSYLDREAARSGRERILTVQSVDGDRATCIDGAGKTTIIAVHRLESRFTRLGEPATPTAPAGPLIPATVLPGTWQDRRVASRRVRSAWRWKFRKATVAQRWEMLEKAVACVPGCLL